MTEFGIRVFLFLLAVGLSLLAIVLEPKADGRYQRLESPKVVVTFPEVEKIRKFARELGRSKALFELIRSCNGKFDPQGFIVAEDFDAAVSEGRRLGNVEIYTVREERVLILRDFGIVAVER